MSAHVLGVFLALTSAAVWGAGDFSGGLAARRISQYQVLALVALSGAGILLAAAILFSEAWPGVQDLGWAILAGASGAFGLAALYRGLSMGEAVVVAPVAALVGALVPVLYGLLTLSWPENTQLLGFGAALLGLWLVTRPPSMRPARFRRGIRLAVLAGVGFGGFLLLIAQVEAGSVFIPLLVARVATLGVAFLMLGLRKERLPSALKNPVAVLAGLLDSGGNVLFLLANQFTRVDVAVVLASLYPAITVLLAHALSAETIQPWQWAGVVICMTAVALLVM